MFKGGVFEYANINARVRAMISTLLTPAQWSELINSPNYNALIGALRNTVYGPYLMRVGEGKLSPRRAVYQIQEQLADVFTKVIAASPDQACPLLTDFYRGFEVDNLKAVLRGIELGSSWSQVQFVLFPYGPTTVLPAQAMVESGSISAAIELTRDTPYYDTLSHALKRFNLEQSLFPLEVALDLNYWRKIWQDINQLSGDDRKYAMLILGAALDVNNLLWAIRYRVYYKLSEEEIINYTLPVGFRVRDAEIRAIAAGADIAEIVSRIFPKITDVPILLAEPMKGLPKLEVELRRTIVEQCEKAFLGTPFQIGVPLGFLMLKEMEVHDLTVLVEAKAANRNPDEFRPYLYFGSKSQ